MALKKISKPKPVITSTTIDADVLARINAKIAKAHELIDAPVMSKKPKVKPIIIHDSEPVDNEESVPIVEDVAEPVVEDIAELIVEDEPEVVIEDTVTKPISPEIASSADLAAIRKSIKVLPKPVLKFGVAKPAKNAIIGGTAKKSSPAKKEVAGKGIKSAPEKTAPMK